jgi:glyoxylase-like metal-dependent hydrolase (beta-lactamase superfamily II)/ferredoxin
MANLSARLPQNVPGPFFVDSTCIDCDTCSQLAPGIFRDHGDQSSVYRQPETDDDARLALMALVACPTGSIGSGGDGSKKYNARIGIEAFPHRIAENVYFCGFTSESTFGGWSYLILREPDAGGNILVDSPRFTSHLVKRISEYGGIERMFLTHRDDIADHDRFNQAFHCERIMHAADGARRLGMEYVIEGDEPIALDPNLLVIPTPGHTRGHMLLLYKNRFLFTGDHLAWSPQRHTLTAFPSVAWYSWEEQTRSMEKLLQYSFEWVLPGHGNLHGTSAAEMKRHLQDCISWMKTRR